MGQFAGVEQGEGAATPTCEGITFFRMTNATLAEQLAYFSRIDSHLLQTTGHGLHTAFFLATYSDEADEQAEFYAGLKAISPSILTLSLNRPDQPDADLLVDHFIELNGTGAMKNQIKSLLGIEQSDCDKSPYPDNPFGNIARKIRREVDGGLYG